MDMDLMRIGAAAFDSHALEVLLRLILLAVGVAVALHFGCMAIVVDGPDVQAVDELLIAGTGAAGVCLIAAALLSSLLHLAAAGALVACMQILFMLRLWCLGFFVSRFYAERGGACS